VDFDTINRYISDERDRVKRNKPKKPAKRGRHWTRGHLPLQQPCKCPFCL